MRYLLLIALLTVTSCTTTIDQHNEREANIQQMIGELPESKLFDDFPKKSID